MLVMAVSHTAPEIIEEKHYDYKVDCWSLGVILFELFSEKQPFMVDSADQTELFEVIRKGTYVFSNDQWASRSPEAKDLVKKLLELDPSKRYSMSQIKTHPWFEKF